MKKFTIDTVNIEKDILKTVITINGVQDLIHEFMDILNDKDLDTKEKKYTATLGAISIFSDTFGYDLNKNNKQTSFELACKPVINWIKENGNPHSSIIITDSDAELLSGEMCCKSE